MTKYVAPAYGLSAFHCPNCNVFAKQDWYQAGGIPLGKGRSPKEATSQRVQEAQLLGIKPGPLAEQYKALHQRIGTGKPALDSFDSKASPIVWNVWFAECDHCSDLTVWVGRVPVWPTRGSAPPPNPDLPADVRVDYLEAGRILTLSPRSAAALLRLAVQKLCVHLGEKGANINADIKSLVSKGLDVHLQQALDVVRVTGNNAVHPGQIDLTDDQETVGQMFNLVNWIADDMITRRKRISELYEKLPDSALEQIRQRDSK